MHSAYTGKIKRVQKDLSSHGTFLSLGSSMYSPKYLHDRLHAAKTDMARTLLYELQPALVCGNRATVELIILAPVPITLLTLQCMQVHTSSTAYSLPMCGLAYI